MKTLYLILYNALCAALWARILLSTLTTPPSSLYPSIEPWARGTQTLAIAEIFHAALGTSPLTHSLTPIHYNSPFLYYEREKKSEKK